MADRVRAQVLEVAHPNAAGIDIGSGSHFVAVRADADERPVREFLSFTEDLEALAQWLKGVYPSARINLGKEEVRCNGRKLFDGVQWVRLPPGKG